MQYPNLDEFLARKGILSQGPVAVIAVEDEVEVASTLRHHLDIGFRTLVILAPPEVDIATDQRIHRIDHPTLAPSALVDAVNAMIPEAPGAWIYYGYNAEYLFFPICETRTVGEMVAFHAGERRDAVLSYVIDLYAPDLAVHANAVDRDSAHLDAAGYYAQARPDAAGMPKLRQLDFFGGLRWRFEEHIPAARRRIDRIALFRAAPGLRLRRDFTFTDEEYNTYACPWHNNITTAVASFRVAKALMTNPGSSAEIDRLHWHGSVRFDWSSRQLMDLGLMEPGQWF